MNEFVVHDVTMCSMPNVEAGCVRVCLMPVAMCLCVTRNAIFAMATLRCIRCVYRGKLSWGKFHWRLRARNVWKIHPLNVVDNVCGCLDAERDGAGVCDVDKTQKLTRQSNIETENCFVMGRGNGGRGEGGGVVEEGQRCAHFSWFSCTVSLRIFFYLRQPRSYLRHFNFGLLSNRNRSHRFTRNKMYLCMLLYVYSLSLFHWAQSYQTTLTPPPQTPHSPCLHG